MGFHVSLGECTSGQQGMKEWKENGNNDIAGDHIGTNVDL